MIEQLKVKFLKKFLPWILGIIYVISPIDIIPDIIGGIGWLDDISVIGLLFWWFYNMKKKGEKTEQAQSSAEKRDTGKQKEGAEEESDPYKILGIERGASKDEIRAAYTRLAAQYHPDRVQHLGDEFRELAHRRFVAIQNAYDQLVK